MGLNSKKYKHGLLSAGEAVMFHNITVQQSHSLFLKMELQQLWFYNGLVVMRMKGRV